MTLAIAPLFRAGGWGVTLLPTLQKGGTVVMASAFDPTGVLELIARHRVTTLFGGPSSWGRSCARRAGLERPLEHPPGHLRGHLVHESLIRAFMDRGIALLQGYGLTEAGPMALMLGEADALRKLGSAGVAPLFVDVRIARSDLSDAAPDEIGEILVRGPNVMRGYWGRPEDTEAALVQGGCAPATPAAWTRRGTSTSSTG